MQPKMTENRLLFIFLLIQSLFVSFIFGMFMFSTYMNKKGMATQIAYQLESNLKSGPNRSTMEALSIAQSKHFKVIGYFDKEYKSFFTFPASKNRSYFAERSLLDRFLNGSIEIPLFFDEQKENLVGTLKYIYPRFAFIPFALLFWLLSLAGSIFLFRKFKKVWLSSLKNTFISKIVNQVSHDLKSPLQTLFVVVDKDSDKIPSGDKQAIHSAIDRIRGIIADLRNYLKRDEEKKSPKKERQPRSLGEAVSITHFYSSLKQLLEEKKMAYREKNIDIQMDCEPNTLKRASYPIKESDFLRTCSNLLLNAYEAVEKQFSGKKGGKIHLSLKEKGENIVLICSDNGIGIPKEHIPKIYDLGFTYGKKKGTGLGLYYVAQKIKQWQGKTRVKISKEGKGTQVEMVIPFSKGIDFFESSLNLSSFEEILIVDDDRSVFHRWTRKLSGFSGKISYLSKPHIPKDKIAKIQAGKCLPLIDQEFRGELETGLSLIIQKGLYRESFLVTNNHCQLDVLKEAQVGCVRIIPKPMIEDLAIS